MTVMLGFKVKAFAQMNLSLEMWASCMEGDGENIDHDRKS